LASCTKEIVVPAPKVVVSCPTAAEPEPTGAGTATETETETATTTATNPLEEGEPPLTTLAFTASEAEILNPERGFYGGVDLIGGSDFSNVRDAGMTLAYAPVHLDAYRDADLPAQLLTDLSDGFARVRSAGIKVVLRFSYNDGGAADASKARILGHLTQLAPVLTANADVIAVLQAGFIGEWGEWHDSTNGLDNSTDRADILSGILAALPPSRMTQVRTPMFKDDAYGGPLTAGFDGSDAARVGHHNDCFLASDSDYGTYDAPVDQWKDFVAAEGQFTPVGGETCALDSPRTDCAEATAELERLHWSFLNSAYNLDVLNGLEAQGCIEDVRHRLGYRVALSEVSYSERVAPGGILHLQVTVENTGYAAMFNARSVVVALGDQQTPIDVDPRLWAPGVPASFDVSLRVPATLAPGSYRLALRLPDPLLPDDPNYAVQLANDGVWDDGDNVITEAFQVDSDAPGQTDATATVFSPL